MQEIQLHSLMTKAVTCLTPQAQLSEAVDLMTERRHSCVVVTDNDKPIGIITERDLVKVLREGDHTQGLMPRAATDFMSSPVITLNENETLFDAMVVSRAEKVRHLPVVNDNGHLVGLITQTDIVNAHFHVIEAQAEIIEKSIAQKTRDLTEANKELLMLSMEDHLMTIGNRRAMEVDLLHTHSQAMQSGQGYAVVLFDIDHFKSYNDHYGHAGGDEALKAVASIMKQGVRGTDRLYRYGGEEILLLLPHISPENACISAQRHIQNLEGKAIPHVESPNKVLTMSAGIGHVPNEKVEVGRWEDVIELADANLYAAKKAGRNQVIMPDTVASGYDGKIYSGSR